MAIVINGSGTITGVSVGGLPDGSVDSDTLATGIDATKLADGTVTSTELQYINSLSSNAQTQISGAGLSSDVSLISRDMATASGTQAVTGVGFQPTCVFTLAVGNGIIGEVSVGFTDSSSAEGSVQNDENRTAGAWAYDNSFIRIVKNGSDIYQGQISSYDADGFTITWTKTGSPTGTMMIKILALK